jgi:muramidase (phage lysozyme)
MTLAEIFEWIEDTPGQHHAIGRYQVIPPTLAELVAALRIRPEERYSPALQDKLADHLMDAAGLPALCSGTMSEADFQNRMARIWAGLPTTEGPSHYEGFAGNTAHLSADEMTKELKLAASLCTS